MLKKRQTGLEFPVDKDDPGLLFLGVLGLQVCAVVSDLWRVGGGKLRRYIVPIVLWV